MFSAKHNDAIAYDTLISANTEICGDVHIKGAVHIDGVIKGNLMAEPGSKATLRISDKGRVEGSITVPNVIINGQVNGDIHAFEYIELAKKARITGNVYYATMEMVMGAQVNGQLLHNQEPTSALSAEAAAAKVD